MARIAIPCLAIGKGQLGGLGHNVDQRGAAGRQVLDTEAIQQPELLEEDWSLAPGTGLADRETAEFRRHRRLDAGPPARQVVGRQQAAMRAPGDVHDLGAGRVAGDGLGDEALVEGTPRGLDLPLAPRPSLLGLGEDAPVHRSERPVGEAAARRRRPTCQVDLGRARPVVTERGRDRPDRVARAGQHRVAMLGIADRVLEHRPER